jgi:putative MATE family efflux protein
MSPRSTRRILEGPLPLEVARFGAPLAVGMGLQTTFNLVDAYMIARLPPEEAAPALGAIGICDQLGALGTIVSYGLSVAAAAVLSRHQGAGDTTAVKRVAYQSLLVVLALGALFACLGIFGGTFLMRDVMSAKGEVARLGAEYLRVQIGGSFTIFLLLHLTTIQRALGSSKTPVSMLIGANAINVVLAALLIFGPGPAPSLFEPFTTLAGTLGIPRMGLMGAAWGAVLSRLIVLVPTTYIVMRRFALLGRDSRERPHLPIMLQLWRLGWPSSAQLVVRIVGMLITHRLVAQTFTTETNQTATTGLGIVFRLETMALFVSLGWGSAAQTFVGQNLGAGRPDRAQSSGWYAAAYDGLMMLGLALLYLRFGPEVVSFFSAQADVVEVGRSYVEAVALSYVGLGVGIALGAAIQGAGATRLTLQVDSLIIFGVQLPASLLVLWLTEDMHRLWQVVAATYLLFAVAYAFVYRRGRFLSTVV